MMSKKSFAVSLLRESQIEEKINEDESKIFEESIVLIKEYENFFSENEESVLLNYFNDNIKPLKYENAYGEIVDNRIVKIIEYNEILDEIEFENFVEVFSRHIIGNIEDTPEMIIEKYYGIK